MLLAENPHIILGPQQAFPDQPYVFVQLSDYVEVSPGVWDWVDLGPEGAGQFTGTPYDYFLLDTGANGILAVDAAAASLEANGYVTEAEFIEIGVAGETIYDVSAPYRFQFTGTDEVTLTLPQAADSVRIQSSPYLNLGGSLDWSITGIPGLLGMPAMTGRVTTFDFSHWSDARDILDWEPMKVTFPMSGPPETGTPVLPDGAGHRYGVAVDNRIVFDPADQRPEWEEPDSPLPTYADVPFMTASVVRFDAQDQPVTRSGTFLVDTGAQFSIISRSVAFSIGLDENGDGSLDDDAFDFVEVGGVGGTLRVPLMLVDQFRLPTEQGVDLVWQPTGPEDLGLQLIVLDLFPSADVDGNGSVGGGDLDVIRTHWGQAVIEGDLTRGDISGDGFVGADDLDMLRGQWGQDVFIDGIFGVDLLTGGLDWLAPDLGDPWFQQVHCDFRNWDTGQGTIYFDLTPDLDLVVGQLGDLDGNGFVSSGDLDIIRANWGQTVTPGSLLSGDPSGDGFVGGDDLNFVRAHWGEGTPPAPAPVPEPSAGVLLLAGALFVSSLRTRIVRGSLRPPSSSLDVF